MYFSIIILFFPTMFLFLLFFFHCFLTCIYLLLFLYPPHLASFSPFLHIYSVRNNIYTYLSLAILILLTYLDSPLLYGIASSRLQFFLLLLFPLCFPFLNLLHPFHTNNISRPLLPHPSLSLPTPFHPLSFFHCSLNLSFLSITFSFPLCFSFSVSVYLCLSFH